MVDITNVVSREIIEKTVDITIDYSELGIDTILQESLLKEIPLVKSVLSFYNITNSIIDRHNVIKLLTFFREFHRKEINLEKLNAFKAKFSQNIKYQNKVVETIILLNERFLQIKKSKILANLLIAHIEENITWQELQDISFVLDSIHPKGFEFLEKMSKGPFWGYHGNDEAGEPFMTACGIGHRHGSKFTISPIGQKLFKFGLKPLTE